MLLDTSAWVEYFEGTEKGNIVRGLLSSEKCYTALTTMAEVASFSIKKGADASGIVAEVARLSEIIDLNKEIAITAGRVNVERKKIVKKWGMMDSFVLATSMLYNFKIATKDTDFKDLDGVEMI